MDRKLNRLCERKAASEREAREGQRAGQGSTEGGADISDVPERASAGFGSRLQALCAGESQGRRHLLRQKRGVTRRRGNQTRRRERAGGGGSSPGAARENRSRPAGPRADAVDGGSDEHRNVCSSLHSTAVVIPVAHGFSGKRGASLVPERKARRRVIVLLWRGGVTQRSGARDVHHDRKPVCDGYSRADISYGPGPAAGRPVG
jgi:hypothetical protein